MVGYTQFFADWALHERTWLLAPRDIAIWRDDFVAARDLFVSIANCVIDFEPVSVLCSPGQATIYKPVLDSRIELVEVVCDDIWLRDSAPSYVRVNKGIRAVRFTVSNGDRVLSNLLSTTRGIRIRRERFALFNNDFSVDGQDSMLLLEAGVCHQHRRQIPKQEIEKILYKRYGVHRMLWLPKALPTDPDNKLINLARFVSPSAILLANHANRRDPCMYTTLDAYDRLTTGNFRNDAGETYSVYQIHNPPPIRWQGRLLCNSYVNSYIANGVVCIPGFHKPKYDKKALELYQAIFPHHEIFQFQVLPLIVHGGGIHCMSFAEPMASTRKDRLFAWLDNQNIQT